MAERSDGNVERCEQAERNDRIALRESNPPLLRLKPKILKLIGLGAANLRICIRPTHGSLLRNVESARNVPGAVERNV